MNLSFLLLSVLLAPAYGQSIDECAATNPVVCDYNAKSAESKIAVCTVTEKKGEFTYKTECVSPSKAKTKGTIATCGCCAGDDASYCPTTLSPVEAPVVAPVTAAPVVAPVTAAPVVAPVTATPAPVTSTPAPVTVTPAPVTVSCSDTPDFKYKGEGKKDCAWVGAKSKRCLKLWAGVELQSYCPRSCGLCGPSPSPSSAPTPTGWCNPELCFNNPDFKHKNCGKFDCKWVAKKTESRCYKVNNNKGLTVFAECPESCAASDFCLDVASKHGIEGCDGDNKYLCPITCGLCDLCPEASTRVSLKPLQVNGLRGGCPAPVEAVPTPATSEIPSAVPSEIPSSIPSISPGPSETPSVTPSEVPSAYPSEVPSMLPTA